MGEFGEPPPQPWRHSPVEVQDCVSGYGSFIVLEVQGTVGRLAEQLEAMALFELIEGLHDAHCMSMMINFFSLGDQWPLLPNRLILGAIITRNSSPTHAT